MEKTNTRSAHRFAFPGSGWVVLLMLASALVGAAAGHFYGAAQPAAAAQVAAPVFTQAEPAVSTATGAALELNQLWEEKRDLRLAQKETRPAPRVGQSNISDETELRQEINAMRQGLKSVRPAAEVAPVDMNTALASGALEQYYMRIFGQTHANVVPVDTNTSPASAALEQYRIFNQKQIDGD